MSRTVAWRTVPYSVSWRRQVLDLMTLVQGHETSEAEFVWWFERNPTKYVNIYLAEWEGRVIGVSSTAPFRVSGDGEEHLVPFSINVLTHPDHRGKGIFSALEVANEEDAVRNGCPLMLSELLAADDTNFAHDVFGIRAKLNRETGALRDGFVPRFAKIAAEELITALRAREQEENE